MRKHIAGWLSRAVLAGLIAIIATSAFAQCNGQFLKNYFCGYTGGSAQGLPGPVTIPTGALTPIAGGTVIGNPTGSTAVPIATTAPILGIPGISTGQIGLAGSTSGTATIKPQNASGSPTLLLPTSSGTIPSTVAAPLALNVTTGQLSITGAAGQVLAGAVPAFTATPTLGASGTLGSLTFGNATSGLVTVQPVTGALGIVTVSLPAASGTVAVSATSPLVENATTGALSCPTCATTVTPSGAALTAGNDTNVTLTLGGSPTNALLNAASITAGWTGQLSLSRGGTNASLSASNGGLVYSTASALAILAGTATANQIPLSGASGAPSWSTATYPATAVAGTVLAAGSANVISATATPTLGANGGTGGQITLNGSSSGAAVISVAAAAGSVTFQLPSTNGSNLNVLQTDGSGHTSWGAAGTGTVTSVSAGTGMAFSTITSSGSVSIDEATTSNIWAATVNKTLDAGNVFNGAGAFQSLSGTSTVTPDFSVGFNFTFTATTATNYTLANPSNPKAGQMGCMELKQPAAGSVVTISYGTQWQAAGGSSSKVLTATLGATDILCYQVRQITPSVIVWFNLANNISH